MKIKREKFWYDMKLHTRYTLEFYKRYKDELGLSGIFKIYDITFDYIIENKELFDSYEGFKHIIRRQQPKKIILHLVIYIQSISNNIWKQINMS